MAPILNFTNLANTTTGTYITNQTYTLANQPIQMTTPEFLIVFSLLGVGLLIVSCLGRPGDIHQDLTGALASIFLFVSGISAWAVDTVTSYGTVVSGTTYILMEGHTIYHYDALGVALAIVFLISLANLYRLWLDYRRITKPDAIDHDRLPSSSADHKPPQGMEYGNQPMSMNTPDDRIDYRPKR